MKNLSDLYGANFKKNRGKASEGFIRPTVGEYFVTHKDYVEIESTSGGWLRTFSGGIDDASGNSIKINNLNDIYVTGSWNKGYQENVIFISKYNTQGELQWDRNLDSNYDRINSGNHITTDSSGNVYITGRCYDDYFFIAKYNSSSELQWYKTLARTGWGQGACYGKSIITDNFENVYIVGDTWHEGSSTGRDIFLVKYNSSGEYQWQYWYRSDYSDIPYSTTTDSSGNFYIVCDVDNDEAAIIKLNTAGEVILNRELHYFGWDPTVYLYGCTTDSLDNLYVTGRADNELIVIKYDSSDVLQWSKKLTVSGFSVIYGYSIIADSSDNIYITGKYLDSTYNVFIAKYNSSGELIWIRGMIFNTGISEGKTITVDGHDNIFITGYYNNGVYNDGFLAKLPSDGSGIGTYSNFTYSEINDRFDSNVTFLGGSLNITKVVGYLEEGDLLLNSSEGSLIEGTLQEIE